MTRFKKIFGNELIFSSLLIVVLCGMAYLPLIKSMGYYGDDWSVTWGGFTSGPSRIMDIYSVDRPFTGVVSALQYQVLGDAPLHWQLWEVILRTAGALAFFWLLRLLWPGQAVATTGMAILFGIYPGFLMMPQSRSALILGVDVGVLSLALTICALRVRSVLAKGLLVLGGAALAAATPLIFEWMIGLEGVRLILIWIALGNQGVRGILTRIRRVSLTYLPYLIAVGAYLYWRVFAFKSTRGATDLGALKQAYLDNPSSMLIQVVIETIKGFFASVIGAWFVPVYNLAYRLRYNLLMAGLGLAVIGVALFLLYARFVKKPLEPSISDSPVNPNIWARDAIWAGCLCVLITLLPVVASNKGVALGDSFDRYTLTAMLGAALIVGGLIFWAVKNPWLRIGFFGLLIGLAMLTHFGNASRSRDITNFQNQFWWQLAWRAPDLETGTVLVPMLGQNLGFVDDYDIWPEANLIYRPEVQDIEIAAQILNRDTAKSINYQIPDGRTLRTMTFERDYAHALIVSYGYDSGQPSCVHVLDGQQIELSQNENPLVPLVAAKSHIGQIRTDAAPHLPPQTIFGSEPAHNWCYYYQKASLARQKGDWAEVVRLGDEAASRKLHANDPSEWMPFIEGYANLGQFDTANQLIKRVSYDSGAQNSLCRRFAPNQPNPSTYIRTDAYHFVVTNLCR